MPNQPDDLHWYYVTQRGARNRPVFAKERRRNVFVRALGEVDLEVHGYCVLPWRYHLLVRATAEQLRGGLRRLIRLFTDWFNAMEGNRGPLLAAQCDWVAIDQAEAIQVLAELHYSPVAAGLVNRWGHYEWSSYPAYIGTGEQPPWLTIARLHPYVQQPGSSSSTIPPEAASWTATDDPFADDLSPVGYDVVFEDSTVTPI